jgi:hypothetical protein
MLMQGDYGFGRKRRIPQREMVGEVLAVVWVDTTTGKRPGSRLTPG